MLIQFGNYASDVELRNYGSVAELTVSNELPLKCRTVTVRAVVGVVVEVGTGTRFGSVSSEM